MIQFNLLPDVKIEYVKAQRTKRLVIGIALIATITSFAVFVLLLVAVQGVQRKNISDLNDDIQAYSKELKDTPDLDKILTIQNQLGSLSQLHTDKVVTSRTFGLMQQVTPSDVTIGDHFVDYTANTMTITGQAPGLDRVNTFVDTLKFASFKRGDEEEVKAFSGVVLEQFGRDEQGSTYSIKLNYDPTLFSIQEQITLSIPKTVTTRSVLGQPIDIFKRSSQPTNSGSSSR
jgi:hypothetical protein